MKPPRLVDIERPARGTKHIGFGTIVRDVKTGQKMKRLCGLWVGFPRKDLIGGVATTIEAPQGGTVTARTEYIIVRRIMVGRYSLWEHLKFWWQTRREVKYADKRPTQPQDTAPQEGARGAKRERYAAPQVDGNC